jgi:hypothetical protein
MAHVVPSFLVHPSIGKAQDALFRAEQELIAQVVW